MKVLCTVITSSVCVLCIRCIGLYPRENGPLSTQSIFMSEDGSNRLARLTLNGTHTIFLTYTYTHVAGVIIISASCLWYLVEKDWKISWQQYTKASVHLYPSLQIFFLGTSFLYNLPSSFLPSLLDSFIYSSLLPFWFMGPCLCLSCLSLSPKLSASNLCVFCLDSPWKVYLSEVDPAVTEISVGGLTPARTYQFRLCAVNQVGRGQYSTETQR